jgi:amidophosphoribosyltransferase
VFEYVYFARPDSVLWGKNVHTVRKAMGRQLAREYPVEADIVIPVPDSGTSAALGYSEEAASRTRWASSATTTWGRTFIEPKQGIRHFGVKVKLNPMREMLEGKRVGGRRRLHRAGHHQPQDRQDDPQRGGPRGARADLVAADPVALLLRHRHADAQGADRLQSQLEEIRRYLGADSLGYLSLDGMLKATGSDPGHFCHACFTGSYRVGIEPEPTPAAPLFDA